VNRPGTRDAERENSAGVTNTITSGFPQAVTTRIPKEISDSSRRIPVGGMGSGAARA
jgi:hypothetical protein